MPRKAPVTDYMIQEYLDITSRGRRLTVGSYLHETLAGKASRYSSRYQDRMVRRLSRMISQGEITQVPSLRGGVSYIPRPLPCHDCMGIIIPGGPACPSCQEEHHD